MTRFKAGAIITINRSILRTNTPKEVLTWHADQRSWWSSWRHDKTLFNGERVFVRFAGTNELIATATVVSHAAHHDPLEEHPRLKWRYEMEFRSRDPVRGIHLRDYGITDGRTRHGRMSRSPWNFVAIPD